jgi:hypothetical protein
LQKEKKKRKKKKKKKKEENRSADKFFQMIGELLRIFTRQIRKHLGIKGGRDIERGKNTCQAG